MKIKSQTLAIGTCVLAMLTAGCKDNKKHTGDGLFPNDTINVGYISYPPGFIVNPNTKEKSGIFNDVLVEIARRNNLKINYKEEVTWATMIEALSINRVDLIANPVWETPERKERADFSLPIYYSPIGIYVRANDNRFDDDFKKINDPSVKIAAVDGEINYYIAKSDFPLAQCNPFPNNIDLAQLFLEIQSGRQDVNFAEPMFVHDYMKKNPGKIKNIGTITKFTNAYMYKKGNGKLGDFINTEIRKMYVDGTIDRIIKHYEPFEGSVISPSADYKNIK